MTAKRNAGLHVVLLLAATLLSVRVAIAQTPGFPTPPHAPTGAPNVLVIMTDDVGFAASSTFGGAIPTPTFERLAAEGLRYNNFHTTALCSPSRASLLTGRNHHAVGFGSVADVAHGEPGYTSIIPKSAATVGQILSAAGYDTAMFGKNHNIPTWQMGPLGPFDQWANGLGFHYFYGFHGGLTNQFAPALIENNSMIDTPKQDGYILDRDLADHAINWLRMQNTQSGGKPFLLYYAPGTAHAPTQAPAEWIAKFKGKFDAGWDVFRQQIFDRQKRLGIIPKNTKLAPMPEVKPWQGLSSDQQRVYARYMEAYAAALAYCDDQIGRVIDEIRRSGRLDNTLVMYIQGDNGASAEGGDDGGFDYQGKVSGSSDPKTEFAHALAHIDEIGGPRSFAIVPAGWAVAMDTPLPYYKAVASRLGGIQTGMVVSWPARIHSRGVRSQFIDISDITPTILEAAGVAAPQTVNGVAQQPFDGTSFAFSFDQPSAATRHTVQYYEIIGHQSIYKDGWFAASRVLGGSEAGRAHPDLSAPWQLYNLREDFSQTTDVSARYPDKLTELRAVYATEAERNHVLPLATNPLQVLLPASRPEVTARAGTFAFYPSNFRYTEGTFPSINNRSWKIDADIDVPDGGGDGVLVTQGGRPSGWGLVVFKGVPTFLYRGSDQDETLLRLAAPQPLESGHHHVDVSFTVAAPGIGKGGAYTLEIDGASVAHAAAQRTVPFKFVNEDATIGHDTGTSLTDEYEPPFAFTGLIHAINIELGPGPTPESATARGATP